MTFIDNIYLKKKIQELTEENLKLRQLIEMEVASAGEGALSADVDVPKILGGSTDTTDTIKPPFGPDSRRGEDDAQGFPQEWLEDFATMEEYLKELYGDPLPADWQDFMNDLIEMARRLYNQGLNFPFWRYMYPYLFV